MGHKYTPLNRKLSLSQLRQRLVACLQCASHFNLLQFISCNINDRGHLQRKRVLLTCYALQYKKAHQLHKAVALLADPAIFERATLAHLCSLISNLCFQVFYI